jgi:transposase-like protein
MRKRRTFTPEFKTMVVLEMLLEGKSLTQTSREYSIKDTVLSRWKKEFLERASKAFEQDNRPDDRDERIAELERMVGKLTMELEMAKKVSKHLR